MHEVKVQLDEDVARWAHHRAAEHETSIARLVSEVLRSRMMQEEGLDGQQFSELRSNRRHVASVRVRRRSR